MLLTVYLCTTNKGELMMCVTTRYEVDCESFKIRVSECVAKSRETLYADPDPDDPHAIRFCVVSLCLFLCK